MRHCPSRHRRRYTASARARWRRSHAVTSLIGWHSDLIIPARSDHMFTRRWLAASYDLVSGDWSPAAHPRQQRVSANVNITNRWLLIVLGDGNKPWFAGKVYERQAKMDVSVSPQLGSNSAQVIVAVLAEFSSRYVVLKFDRVYQLFVVNRFLGYGSTVRSSL